MPVNSFDNYPLTWKPDKDKLRSPYYKYLSDDLEKKIINGLLKPGTLLPPQREIADYLDINYTTITRVYDNLKKKGLIYGVMGKGTYVAYFHEMVNEEVNGDCIELGAVNAFSQYSDLVYKATREVIEKGYLHKLYEYSKPEGHPHQLMAAKRWLEQLNVHCDIDELAILTGAQNALCVALLALFHPNDKIACDEFTYANLIDLAKMLNIILVPIDNDDNGMIADDLEKKVKSMGIKGVYLMPGCSNPTTIIMPMDRRKAIARVIKENDLILIEDDISAWLFADEMAFTSFYDLLDHNSVYICGMTKSLCPGLRIAYMAFSRKYRKNILNAILNVNIKTSSLDAEIISQLVLNGDGYKIASKKKKMTKEACDIYYQYFDDKYHNVSYYKWLKINCDKPMEVLENELLALGVRVYHSDRFKVKVTNNNHYLRISLCSCENKQKLKKGLEILKHYLDNN